MDFNEAKRLLADALMSLHPAGPDGFEGLLRDVLVEVTHMSFALAKSGPQEGSDVRSIGQNLFEVALEAKRYAESTALKVDALQSKLFECSRSEKATDLWILAATRAISATDNEKLTRAGVELGITVLVLDWPPEEGVLPDLATLCATADHAVGRHLGGTAELSDIVATIRAHSGYDAALERLRQRLSAPDIGYAATAEAMKEWTVLGLKNERNAASRLGGKFNNVLDCDRKRIRRPKYELQLDRWFESGKPAVLLGDEGYGKTWQFLSWWHARAEEEGRLPLTLFVPAREVDHGSVHELIPRLLSSRLGHGGMDFWKRRVKQWLKLRAERPVILLMIDGLNQHWQKRDWAEVLQPAFDDDWNGRLRVIMTCWPDHWSQLHQLASLTPKPLEIPVERFDDGELDSLLAEHGLTRSEFSDPMLDLMKVPRLSALTIARRQELASSGDLTPERLAVEDWKHRIESRGTALELTDGEFRNFVADLGEQLHTAIDGIELTRRELLDRLGRENGKEPADLRSTLAEMIAGRWLAPTERANSFRVNQELVPFALGLALNHQLRVTREEGQAEAILADFMDPIRGQSLGVRTLRAAVTIALVDQSATRHARRVLLVRWIQEQNFSNADFEAFWRIIGLDPELVLDVTEEHWLAESSGSFFADEVMIKGLANAHQFETVAPVLEARITRWLGIFWEDPHQGLFVGKIDLTAPESVQRQAATRANLAQWRRFEGRTEFPPIEPSVAGNPSWLSRRAFGVMSYLPRAPFMCAIAAWGISRAVMGLPRHFDELAWVLRLNGCDQAALFAEVHRLVGRLLASGHPLTNVAACWILEALADAEAVDRLESVRPDAPSSYRRASKLSLPADDDILNPAMDVSPEKMAEALQSLRPNRPFDAVSSHHRLILARTNPTALRQLLHSSAMNASGLSSGQLRQRLNQLIPFLAVLSSEERVALLTAIDATLEQVGKDSPQEADWWAARHLELRLANCRGREKLNLILSESQNRLLLAQIRESVIDVAQDDVAAVLLQVDVDGDQEVLLCALTLLVKLADCQTIGAWSKLPVLLRHPDRQIAELAIALTGASDDLGALRVIADATWTASDAATRTERFQRSHALLRASQRLSRPELLERVDAEIAAVWVCTDPDNPHAVQAYETFVRSAVERLRQPRSSASQPLLDHRRALALLLERASENFWEWLEGTLKSEIKISSLDLMEQFPLLQLAEALMGLRPELGLVLWGDLKEVMERDIIKTPQLPTLPFLTPDGTADGARNEVLSSVCSDRELADIVLACEKGEGTGRLIERAQILSDCSEPSSLAKATMLLAFANETEKVEEAWSKLRSRLPKGGWLEDVYQHSHRRYEENKWARAWFLRFIQAMDPSEACAAHLLLTAVIDSRCSLWLNGELLVQAEPWKRRYWDMNLESLNSAIKSREEKLKETLFWTKLMKQSHWPWL